MSRHCAGYKGKRNMDLQKQAHILVGKVYLRGWLKKKKKRKLYGKYNVLVLHTISYVKLAGFVNTNEAKPLKLFGHRNNIFFII